MSYNGVLTATCASQAQPLPSADTPARPSTAFPNEVRQALADLGPEGRRQLVQSLSQQVQGRPWLLPVFASVTIPLGETASSASDVLALLLNDPDDYIHRTAACILARIGDPKAVSFLGNLFQHEKDRAKRREIINALAGSSQPDAVAILVAMTDPTCRSVRPPPDLARIARSPGRRFSSDRS
jgi:HEAT repeat protein